MSRRPLSDQRHLLVELELDESVLGDARSPQRWQEPRRIPYESTQSHRRCERPARPQSATVRRTSTSSDRKNSSPFKLKQKVLSSRSRAALDLDDSQPQQRRTSTSTSQRQDDSVVSPLVLIADAIRQNITQRHQLLMEIQDELRRISLLPQTRRSTHQQPALLPSSVIKMFNRLRSVTLSIVEMVRYFHEQLPSAASAGDATLWGLRHEFQSVFTRLCASDVDCLLIFPPIVYLFESLGANALRNPLLDGVSLDSSELLLCSCQSSGSTANVTSSSLFRLIVSRLEAFAIQVRQAYPSWQVLPHDRVARALLDLLESETKANATRLLPSYLRSENDWTRPFSSGHSDDGPQHQRVHYEDDDKLSNGRRPQYAASSPSPMSQSSEFDDGVEENESQVWMGSRRQSQTKTPSNVWTNEPVEPMSQPAMTVAATPIEQKPKAPDSQQTPTATAIVKETPLPPPQLSAVAEPKTASLGLLATGEVKGSAKKAAKKLQERSLTVSSLLFPPSNRSNEAHAAFEAKSTVAELLHAAEKKRDREEDRVRATIASALDKLPQFSFDALGVTHKIEPPAIITSTLQSFICATEEATRRTEHGETEVRHSPVLEELPASSDDVTLQRPGGDDTHELEEKETDVDSGNVSAFSRIMSLCRDVQVAAIDMNQRLDQTRFDEAKRSTALVPSVVGFSSGSTPRYPLSCRYLERELKMLRRFFRLWQAALAQRHERLLSLRIASAARRIGRFARHTLAQQLAAKQLKRHQLEERMATRIQRQWQVSRSRQQARKRQQVFCLMHCSFHRYRFFTRLMQRRRKRMEAQRTLQQWWRRLYEAKKAEKQRTTEEEAVKARRMQAAKQLQGFVREQLLRSQLTKALAANRSFMMKEKLKQTRARQEEEKRLMLESKRRAEMRVAMQQALREMETRWKEAEAAKALLQQENEKRLVVERQQAERLARELARARIHRFLERSVLRRRLQEATRANVEIAQAKRELEIVRERLERRQRDDQTKHLLQERMLWWKMNKAVKNEQSNAQQKLREQEARRRAEQVVLEEKLHTQALKAVARTNVAELLGAVTGDVVEQTYQKRLRAKRKEARQLRRRAANERIAGFVWQCWTNHLLRMAERRAREMERIQAETEARERQEREAKALAEAREKRAISERRIAVWLSQQLARRKEIHHQQEEAARMEAERATESLRRAVEEKDRQRKKLEAAVERERLRLEEATKQLEQQRQKEREAEQLVRVQLIHVMMETQKTADRMASTTLTRALADYSVQCQQLELAARVRKFFVRLLVRKVATRWRQFTLRRLATKGITTEALWPLEKQRSATSQLMANAHVELELDQSRALRLFELKCIASARKVQRCWRSWHRQLRRQKRLQAKAEEDALVALAKGGVKAAGSTQQVVDSVKQRVGRWLRSHIRNKRLTWPVKTPEGVLYIAYFAVGRAWVRSLSTADNQGKTRVRFDRVVTRKLLLAAEPGVHLHSELAKLFHTLISDVRSVIAHAATSPRAVEKPDGWLEIGDVDEIELAQFSQMTRQLTKTRSIFKRQQLLDAKAASASDCSTASSSTCLTIFDAVESASVEDAQFLLQHGADLHTREPCHQRTALHMLAFSTEPVAQRVALLHFLIDRAKLDVHTRDSVGDTALMLFAAQGCVCLVDAMLAVTPFWWRETTSHTHTTKTPTTAMHRACERDQPEAAAALQRHVLTQAMTPAEQRELLLELHRCDASGLSPLHILAMCGHVECIRGLLTTLDMASRVVLLRVQDTKRGGTPLHYAVYHSHVDATKTLVAQGADVHQGDAWQCSPLHYACRSPNAEELIALFTDTSSVDWQHADERGDTALHWAASSGRVHVVRQLLVLGADPTVLNNDWETPAQVAAMRGHGDCLRLLQPASGHSADVGLSFAMHAPVRDVTQELPSPKSYCHPHHATTSSATPGGRNAPTKGEYDWNEIHKDVQLVEESGHFSSEDEDDQERATLGSDSDDDM